MACAYSLATKAGGPLEPMNLRLTRTVRSIIHTRLFLESVDSLDINQRERLCDGHLCRKKEK